MLARLIDLLILTVITGLATWRVTHIILSEDGPYHIFERLRLRLRAGEFSDENVSLFLLSEAKTRLVMDSEPRPHPLWTEVLNCFWCASIWVSFGLTLLMAPLFVLTVGVWSISAMAVSAFAAATISLFVERFSNGAQQ